MTPNCIHHAFNTYLHDLLAQYSAPFFGMCRLHIAPDWLCDLIFVWMLIVYFFVGVPSLLVYTVMVKNIFEYSVSEDLQIMVHEEKTDLEISMQG